jgi:hypothetical protein
MLGILSLSQLNLHFASIAPATITEARSVPQLQELGRSLVRKDVKPFFPAIDSVAKAISGLTASSATAAPLRWRADS